MFLPLYMAAITSLSPATEHWFEGATCASIKRLADHQPSGARYPQPPPAAYRIAQQPFPPGMQPSGEAIIDYWYDPAHNLLFRFSGAGYGGDNILMRSSRPPGKFHIADLSTVTMLGGLRVGSSASDVVRRLGKPFVTQACGSTLYVYDTGGQNAPGEMMRILISNGRVSIIWWQWTD